MLGVMMSSYLTVTAPDSNKCERFREGRIRPTLRVLRPPPGVYARTTGLRAHTRLRRLDGEHEVVQSGVAGQQAHRHLSIPR